MRFHFQLNRRNHHSGFTILEVLLATAIFAMVIVGLATTLNQAINASSLDRKYTHIRLTLDSKLAEALQEAQQSMPADDKAWKPIATDTYGIRYEKQILTTDFKNRMDKLLPQIFRITIRASWTEGLQPLEEKAEVLYYKAQ